VRLTAHRSWRPAPTHPHPGSWTTGTSPGSGVMGLGWGHTKGFYSSPGHLSTTTLQMGLLEVRFSLTPHPLHTVPTSDC
jgi:hypothetical protein